MMKVLTVIAVAGALASAGCGDKVQKAEPAFKSPPSAQLGQIDTKPGVVSGELKTGSKVK